MGFKLSVKILYLVVVFVCISASFREFEEAHIVEEQPTTEYCMMPGLGNAVSTGSLHMRPEIVFQEHTKVSPKESRFARYRTADGRGNHVFNLGMANTPPSRILPPDYEDGVKAPRTQGVNGSPLPAPLDVSRLIHTDTVDFMNFTVMLMVWGQFIDHDMAAFILSAGQNGSIKCCVNGSVNPVPNPNCFPLLKSAADTRFESSCLEFSRSLPARDANGVVLSPRQQINTATSFLDASMVYGSSQEVQLALREKLPSGKPSHLLRLESGELLPQRPEDNCNHRPGLYCFLAGDDRVNEQPGLTVIHTLFVQLHNAIAQELLRLRPQDTREGVFQLTRKIVGAIVQNIHYDEWLPLFLPHNLLVQYDLLTGQRTRYLPTVDPSIFNAFATAVFRMGHTLIPAFFNVSGIPIPLRQLFNKPDIVFDDFNGLLLSLVSPLVTNGARAFDRFVTQEVTGHLFEPVNQPPPPAPSRGLDLVALNLQRGRDHGLPSYNRYREICGFKRLTAFIQFVPQSVGSKLATVYDDIDDVDLFTGLMSEQPLPGGLVGPTLACLLGIQFNSLKFGDRFYFETRGQIEGFTDDQLAAIRRVTMAHVCCMSKRVDNVQAKSFQVFNEITNPMVKCSDLRSDFINLTLFQ